MNSDTKSVLNTLNVLIVIIIILVLVYFCFNTTNTTNIINKEGFTNDEAIQNIASVYNTGTMTVTNSNVTSVLTAKTAAVQGDLNVTGASNLTGKLTSANAQINNLTAPIANITTLNVTGNANTTGNLLVNGTLKSNGIFTPTGGEQAIVIYLNQKTTPNQWDQTLWVRTVSNYFKKSMPDGTMLNFIFVYFYDGNLRAANTNYHVIFFTGVKVGNQVLCYEGAPRHQGIGDVYNSTSNDASWRAIITNP